MTARAARKIPVYLAVCSSYDRAVVASLLEEMAGPLGLASSYSGQTVLLKPNLISAAAPALACTDAGFTPPSSLALPLLVAAGRRLG